MNEKLGFLATVEVKKEAGVWMENKRIKKQKPTTAQRWTKRK